MKNKKALAGKGERERTNREMQVNCSPIIRMKHERASKIINAKLLLSCFSSLFLWLRCSTRHSVDDCFISLLIATVISHQTCKIYNTAATAQRQSYCRKGREPCFSCTLINCVFKRYRQQSSNIQFKKLMQQRSNIILLL
jgi:hypothetical protein